MIQIPRLHDKQVHRFELTFYKSLRTFLFVCQCCGTAPIDLRFVDFSSSLGTGKRSYREYLKCILHGAACTFALCGISIATYFQYEEFNAENILFLTRILYFGEYISGILNTAFIFVGCYYQRNRYGDYFRRFSQIFLKLATFGVAIDFAQTRKIISRFLFGYLAFFGFVILTDFMYNRSNLKAFMRSSTVYSLPNIIAAMALAEYFLLLDLLVQCYAKIGIILQTISGVSDGSSPNAFERDLNHVRKWTMSHYRFINDQQRVEQLRLLCLELNHLNSAITASCGLLIISTMVSTFIILSIQFYTFYTIFEGFVTKDTWLTIYTLLWVILHGGKTFLILSFNQFVSDEVNQLPTITCSRNE